MELRFINFHGVLKLVLIILFISFILVYTYKKIKNTEEENIKDELDTIYTLTNKHLILKMRVNLLKKNNKSVQTSIKLIYNTSEIKEQLSLQNNLVQEFSSKLKQQHSKLTDSDVLICYYLFLNFKSSEIAFILNLSIKSIRNIRCKLIEKLNIEEQNTSLLEYLNSQYISLI